ncbi:MAG: hypothetical protein NZ580_05830 [Bacteroidia bacterium]|nr:hypothetical protein [Bacteroidia bacterium]MDW8236145.1 hypothetical protein [Bacteroidia bacterium]
MLWIFLLSWAQVQITAADLPTPRSTYYVAQSRQSRNVDFTATGAGYDWDFRSLRADTILPLEWKSPIQAPEFAFSCGNASLQALLLKLQDSLFSFSNVQVRDLHAFFRKSTSQLTLTGVGVKVNGFPSTTCHIDPDEVYNLPLTQGRFDSTTFYFRLSFTLPSPPVNVVYASRGYRLHRVDGHGQVQTPSFQAQCLRLRRDTYQKDTVYVGGLPFARIDTSYTDFEWLAQGQGIPLLRVTGTWSQASGTPTFQPAIIQYKTTQPTSLAYSGSLSIFLHPNPAQHYVCGTPAGAAYHLYDGLGRVIATGHASAEGYIYFPEPLAPGAYMLRMVWRENEAWSKVLIAY